MHVSSQIIIALDNLTTDKLLNLVNQFDSKLCRLKVGMELFTREGPKIIEILQKKGFEIFLDLKYHDIPNTVKQACKTAAELGVWMLNVHALGGRAMLEAAREGAWSGSHRPILMAVTILTSLNEADLKTLNITETIPQQVLHLAHMTQQAGLSGVVCSAQEAPTLREACGEEFCLLTPGIHLEQVAYDQQRSVHLKEARARGINYFVIGRAITQAADPAAALQQATMLLNSEDNA